MNDLVYSYKGSSMKLLDILKDLKAEKNSDLLDTFINRAVSDVLDMNTRNFLENHKDIFIDDEFTALLQNNTGISTQEGMVSKIEEYIWNSMYMTSQLIQVVTTDLAYYKGSVDFQKRFKEVYAAGTKLNTNSKYGRKEEKTVYISDLILTSLLINHLISF